MKDVSGVAFTLATQNLNAVLRVMQWGVITLIFLFFLRVIRAVWVEVSPATIRKTRSEKRQEKRASREPRPETKGPKGRQLYLRVVEPDAHEGEEFDISDEVTIGRSLGCAVVTPDDIYTSSVHARLFRLNGQVWVEDLGSTNGTYVNSERIAQAHRLAKGDVLQVGSTVFEVRR
ncbi:MAG TPA: FHA domain-containing protein [Acidimicrobiales bacterium]|nr:FHA domain-containing protein [Acidimicrobiales bacterium]